MRRCGLAISCIHGNLNRVQYSIVPRFSRSDKRVHGSRKSWTMEPAAWPNQQRRQWSRICGIVRIWSLVSLRIVTDMDHKVPFEEFNSLYICAVSEEAQSACAKLIFWVDRSYARARLIIVGCGRWCSNWHECECLNEHLSPAVCHLKRATFL